MNSTFATSIIAVVLTSTLITSAHAQTPKYKADVPRAITTPDTVDTRIGTLKFTDGLPDADTIKKVYDNLDFVRGVEAFMLGMPAASIQAMRRGYAEGGFPSNQGFGISESLADARSLFLTPNFSGMKINTVHANDVTFFDELNEVVQHEPDNFLESEVVGILASIGIKKGKPFKPDARMKVILTDAAAVANATSRALTFAPRDPLTRIYPDRQWMNPFTHLNHEFADGGERLLDARTMSFYYYTGLSPMMASPQVGKGAAYVYTARDGKGEWLDGSKSYKVTLPPNVPAGLFWSFNVYDNQHRSFLETDQKLAGFDSTLPGLKKNADGSFTVWFGPKAPAGQEGNWVQTWPGKGFNAMFRLYSPLQGWFDKSWKPGDFELVN